MSYGKHKIVTEFEGSLVKISTVEVNEKLDEIYGYKEVPTKRQVREWLFKLLF